MKTTKNIIISVILLFFTSNSFAEDVTIEMLNKLGKESMVYSKKIVRIDVGDSFFGNQQIQDTMLSLSKAEFQKE